MIIQLLIPAMLFAMTASAKDRDLTPSIGVTYSKLDLKQDASEQDAYFGLVTDSIVVDLRWPVTQWLDVSVAGGPSVMKITVADNSLALRTVTVDTNGRIIGAWGNAAYGRRTESLNGYSFSASAIFYFR